MKGLRTDESRDLAKRAKVVKYFHGKEGKCNDSSLLSWDDVQGNFDRKHYCEIVRFALKFLNDRDEKIVKLRFGIDFERAFSLDECGQMLGLNKERARQLEARAIARLVRHFDLKDFSEKDLEDLEKFQAHLYSNQTYAQQSRDFELEKNQHGS